LSKTLIHFSSQTLMVNEYSPFNPITLNFFYVSNMFHDSICVVYTIQYVLILISTKKHVPHIKTIY